MLISFDNQCLFWFARLTQAEQQGFRQAGFFDNLKIHHKDVGRDT